MAFNSSAPRAEYVATSGQTVFPFLFKIYNETDIVVYQQTSPAEPVLLLLTTDYTVTIDGDNGGEITLVAGATEDDNITILRSLPLTRNFEYQTSGDLLADTLNMDQEYQTYLIADQIDRLAALEAGDVAVSAYVLKSGDTMAGQLKGITPVDSNDLTRKDYVDNADSLKLNLTGGTVTGQIKGITPVSAGDLTRKDYVDAVASSYDASKSLTANGYQFFGNGLIIQWGSFTTTTTGDEIHNFPIAFTTGCLSLAVVEKGALEASSFGCQGFTATTFTINTSSISQDGYYIAIGY